jgi:hypothetical protein
MDTESCIVFECAKVAAQAHMCVTTILQTSCEISKLSGVVERFIEYGKKCSHDNLRDVWPDIPKKWSEDMTAGLRKTA